MRAISIGLFLLRHAVMTPVIAAILCAGWVAFYLVLLVTAIIVGGGAGGPLALPAGLIAVVAASAVVGWGIFVPACAIGAAIRSLVRPPLLVILLAVWFAGTLLGSIWVRAFVTCLLKEPSPPFAETIAWSALGVSVPLGLYWWATEGAAMLPDMAIKALRGLRRKAKRAGLRENRRETSF